MPVYGLTAAGFVKRDAESIVKQLEADEIAGMSPSLDVSSASPMGQVNGAVTKHAVELWDLAQATYIAGDPDRNTGDGQDAVAAITGTTREPATHSQVAVTLNLDATSLVSAGALMSVFGSPTVLFELVGPEPPVNVAVAPGDVISTIAGSYAARFQAVATGPVVASATTLHVIVTPSTGWNSGTNPLDAVIGHNIETSSALRLRREQELSAVGSTPVDALRAELYQLLADNNVVGFVSVVENVQDIVDGEGRDPHSIEALVDDTAGPVADDAIAQTIWDGKAGGIKSFGITGPGSSSGTAIDTLGRPHTIDFTRPVLQEIWFVTTVVIDPALFPGDGVAQIQAAMVAHGALLGPGDDVARASFFGAMFSVPGVQNVTVLLLGTSDPPTLDLDIPIGIRERAVFDTSRIEVTVI